MLQDQPRSSIRSIRREKPFPLGLALDTVAACHPSLSPTPSSLRYLLKVNFVARRYSLRDGQSSLIRKFAAGPGDWRANEISSVSCPGKRRRAERTKPAKRDEVFFPPAAVNRASRTIVVPTL